MDTRAMPIRTYSGLTFSRKDSGPAAFSMIHGRKQSSRKAAMLAPSSQLSFPSLRALMKSTTPMRTRMAV